MTDDTAAAVLHYFSLTTDALAMVTKERDRYRVALEAIALGRAVNPQGFAMLTLDEEQTAQQFHRPGTNKSNAPV